TWVAKGNKVYTASNNTDTIRLMNASGCDSIVTLNLTITTCPLTTLGINSILATSAYSLRKLSADYTGAAIQVVRSDNNATQNIGFTAGGDLDTAALKTFVGSNNGFISIWYDQSGNARNVTQTNASKRPAIINAGVIYRRGGKPTVFFDGTDDGMLFTGTDYITTNGFTVNLVAGSNSASTSTRRAVQGNSITNNWLVGPYTNAHTWFAGGFNHLNATAWSTTQVERFTVTQNNSGLNGSFRNGSSIATDQNKSTVPGTLCFGAEGGFAEPLNGFISEVVSFTSVLNTTDRQSMDASEAAYYVVSANANLTSLTTTPTTTLAPNFATDSITYKTSVANAVATISVTPTLQQANATISVSVNGGTFATVASGNASGNLALNVGLNTIDVKVTAQDGTTIKIYRINVTRASGLLTNLGITSSIATSAYSLRKLSADYAGAAIQVIRSSDNFTLDIGFTASGDLDTAALKSFVGSNNAFVTTWYDQSGNARNVTQTTAANQPSIINAGVIFRRGNKPTVFFDGTNDGMLFSGTDYLT
ncbi:MAG: arabinofuranosidase catalytic domain-containing protein, partial [Chitinophagaceae bacterium]